MYPYMNEDVAWERLKDVQREMENSRLLAEQAPAAVARLARYVAGRIWKPLTPARPVQRHEPLAEELESASDAA